VGSTSWFQGYSGAFSAQAGSDTSYIAANFNNANNGAISDWLISPALTFFDTRISVRFYTRVANAGWSDMLQLLLSTSGTSGDVGSTATSTGVFASVATVNPVPDAYGYPDQSTFINVKVSGLTAGSTGRLAFRYVVADSSSQGDLIGIDTLNIYSVPEPATLALLALGLGGLSALGRRRR
jgi:hypothetical protein